MYRSYFDGTTQWRVTKKILVNCLPGTRSNGFNPLSARIWPNLYRMQFPCFWNSIKARLAVCFHFRSGHPSVGPTICRIRFGTLDLHPSTIPWISITIMTSRAKWYQPPINICARCAKRMVDFHRIRSMYLTWWVYSSVWGNSLLTFSETDRQWITSFGPFVWFLNFRCGKFQIHVPRV